MTRMAPLLRWRKRGNVSAPSPPTFYYRRDTLRRASGSTCVRESHWRQDACWRWQYVSVPLSGADLHLVGMSEC